jgi:hypothetical protein
MIKYKYIIIFIVILIIIGIFFLVNYDSSNLKLVNNIYIPVPTEPPPTTPPTTTPPPTTPPPTTPPPTTPPPTTPPPTTPPTTPPPTTPPTTTPPCISNCGNKNCGLDNCGRSCGICPTNLKCDTDGICKECTSDNECPPGKWCQNNRCVDKEQRGSACTDDRQCLDSSCVNNRCLASNILEGQYCVDAKECSVTNSACLNSLCNSCQLTYEEVCTSDSQCKTGTGLVCKSFPGNSSKCLYPENTTDTGSYVPLSFANFFTLTKLGVGNTNKFDPVNTIVVEANMQLIAYINDYVKTKPGFKNVGNMAVVVPTKTYIENEYWNRPDKNFTVPDDTTVRNPGYAKYPTSGQMDSGKSRCHSGSEVDIFEWQSSDCFSGTEMVDNVNSEGCDIFTGGGYRRNCTPYDFIKKSNDPEREDNYRAVFRYRLWLKSDSLYNTFYENLQQWINRFNYSGKSYDPRLRFLYNVAEKYLNGKNIKYIKETLTPEIVEVNSSLKYLEFTFTSQDTLYDNNKPPPVGSLAFGDSGSLGYVQYNFDYYSEQKFLDCGNDYINVYDSIDDYKKYRVCMKKTAINTALDKYFNCY